jgi:hypothetical protein
MDGRMWPAARDLTDMRIIFSILLLYMREDLLPLVGEI